jgi:hypothetical protein
MDSCPWIRPVVRIESRRREIGDLADALATKDVEIESELVT